MKIAVSAKEPTIETDIDVRFGRCPHFVIVDLETMESEILDNANTMAAGGVGISTAQVIVDKGVEAVLTGNCGPNAYKVLSAAGIKVITRITGNIRDAIEEYKKGNYSADQEPSVAEHHGMSKE